MSLSVGARSDAVRDLQTKLVALGYLHPVDADGIFGAKTDASVRAFQRDRGLTVDGIAGPGTMAAIAGATAKPADPDLVTLRTGLVVPRRRIWPLAELADRRRPHVTSGHAVKNPSRPDHYGADIVFQYKPGVDPAMKKGDGGRSSNDKWWVPENTPARAGADGEIVFAGPSKTGWRVWIRHKGDGNTGYFHLTKLDGPHIVRGKVLELGTVLGLVGDNPAATDLRHLHFENYRGDIFDDVAHGRYPRGTLDPEAWLEGAELLTAS